MEFDIRKLESQGPIKRRKRQKFIYCTFACKNFLSSLHCVRRWWHSNDDM